MPHAQPRMTACLNIPGRTAETINQKIAKPFFRSEEIMTLIQRSQNIVGWNLAVEGGDQPLKSILADRGIDLMLFHGLMLAKRDRSDDSLHYKSTRAAIYSTTSLQEKCCDQVMPHFYQQASLATLFVATLISGLPTTAATPVSFNVPQRDMSVPGLPQWIATGDFNGDGIVDLITTDQNHNVLLSLGNGDGTFASALKYAIVGQPDYVVVGDFNNDGNLDAIVTIFTNQQLAPGIVVLLGNGDGTFRMPVSLAIGTSYDLGIPAAGDLNHDGKLDLVLPGTNANGVFVLLGNGDGTFRPTVVYPAGTDPRVAQIGDFNGDHIPDIALCDSKSVAVLPGKGDGTFGPALYSTGLPNASGFAVADLNGDGKLDAVLSSQSIGVLLGNGDGTFQAPVAYQAGQKPATIALADLNGDGKLDVVSQDQNSVSLSVLLGNGDGTLRAATHYPFNAQFGLVVADFNRDGKLDAASTSPYEKIIPILFGNGDGTFKVPPSYPVTAGESGVGLATADFSGDRKLDLITANAYSEDLSLLVGNGNGTFQAPLTIATPGFYPTYVVTADFNGDGKMDVAAASGKTSNVAVLLGNGNATFQAPVVSAAGGPPIAMAAGDGATGIVVSDGVGPVPGGPAPFSRIVALFSNPRSPAKFPPPVAVT